MGGGGKPSDPGPLDKGLAGIRDAQRTACTVKEPSIWQQCLGLVHGLPQSLLGATLKRADSSPAPGRKNKKSWSGSWRRYQLEAVLQPRAGAPGCELGRECQRCSQASVPCAGWASPSLSNPLKPHPFPDLLSSPTLGEVQVLLTLLRRAVNRIKITFLSERSLVFSIQRGLSPGLFPGCTQET